MEILTKENIIKFAKIFILFIIIDLIWIKIFAEKKYKNMIKDIQGVDLDIKIIPALFVYVLMALLFILFRTKSNIKMFLLGFLTYGIYDMTNYSLITKFDPIFGFADMLWGGILFSVVNKLL
jgi:uncharacterized membrane protein